MPREIRTLKRSSFTDEKLCSVPREVRLTFMGLIANADDYGRLRADPRLLKASIYPLDDALTAADVSAEIATLVNAGLVQPYEVHGVRYLELANFEKHQKMSRKYGSDIPAPDADAVRTHAPAVLTQCARTEGEERSGEGEEKERSGEGRTVVIAAVPEIEGRPAEEFASLVGMLPPLARRILDTFYEPAMTEASRKRYANVAAQMLDTITPNHPGPKIRGGQRVKARSPEHLNDTCASVLRDPPMNRDAAIVFVLQKLLDPPKGPSVTEVAKRLESAEIAREEMYDRAARAAGVAWAKAHPAEYEPIRLSIETAYHNRGGRFAEAAKTAELTQRCAKAAGFPLFDQWHHDTKATA